MYADRFLFEFLFFVFFFSHESCSCFSSRVLWGTCIVPCHQLHAKTGSRIYIRDGRRKWIKSRRLDKENSQNRLNVWWFMLSIVPYCILLLVLGAKHLHLLWSYWFIRKLFIRQMNLGHCMCYFLPQMNLHESRCDIACFSRCRCNSWHQNKYQFFAIVFHFVSFCRKRLSFLLFLPQGSNLWLVIIPAWTQMMWTKRSQSGIEEMREGISRVKGNMQKKERERERNKH